MLEFCIQGQTQDSLLVNKVVQIICKVMFKFNSESPCRCFKIPTPTITSREQNNSGGTGQCFHTIDQPDGLH